jgi:hypothetical protein
MKLTRSPGRPGFRVTQVPPRVGRDGHFQFGQAHATEVVAVGIDLRDEDRERFADAGRLFGNDPVLPLRTEVEVKGLMHALRQMLVRDFRKFYRVAPHECLVGEFWITARGRCFVVAHPVVHRGEKGASEIEHRVRVRQVLSEQDATFVALRREGRGEMLQPGEKIDADIVEQRDIVPAIGRSVNE